MDLDFDKNHERALKLLDGLIELTSTLTIDEVEENISTKEFSILAHYNKAEIFFKLRNQDELLTALRAAISVSEPVFKPALKLFLFNSDSSNQNHLLPEIVDDIIGNQLEFVTRSAHGLSFTKGKLHQILVRLLENNHKDEYDKLIDYYRKRLLKSEISENELIYELSQFTSNLPTVKTLLLPLTSEKDLSPGLMLKMLRRLANVSFKSNEFLSHFIKYRDAFASSFEDIESSDITVFSLAIKTYSDTDKYNDAIDSINAIECKLKDLTNELLVESSIIYYWAAILYFKKNNKVEALKHSNKTLEILEANPTVHSSIIDEEGINSIKKSMHSIQSYYNRVPVIASKKYSRNDKVTVRYSDGLVIEGKYKRFEQDIELKKCVVI